MNPPCDRPKGTFLKNFSELTEREILSLAIDAEDNDQRVYSAFAEDLSERYPSTAKIFSEMAHVEASHHDALLKTYRGKFGPNLSPIRRADIRRLHETPPIWLIRNLPLAQIRTEVEQRETEGYNFYTKAAAQTKDPAIRNCSLNLPMSRKAMRRSRAISRPNI